MKCKITFNPLTWFTRRVGPPPMVRPINPIPPPPPLAVPVTQEMIDDAVVVDAELAAFHIPQHGDPHPETEEE